MFISVMETAGEGGAWGISSCILYAQQEKDESLEDCLSHKVFSGKAETIARI